MINSYARRIQAGRVRISGVELGKAVSQVLSVRQRKCVQDRLHCGLCLLSQSQRWNIGETKLRQAQSQALIREKEEGLVASAVSRLMPAFTKARQQHGAAKGSAKVILSFGRLRLSIRV